MPSRSVRRWVEPLDARTLLAAVAGNIDFGQTHQTMEGLGASFANWISPVLLPQFADAGFYDQLVNDLGASAVRGPIHQNFEFGNDNDDPNVFDWSGFNIQPLANTFTFFKRMHERGVRTFLLSVWSPPYWQKTSYATLGGGFLRPEMRAEFAEWVAAAVIVAKRDYDIDITAVSVQNEQFFQEWYESSLMDNLMLREVTLAVQKKLAAENLPTKVLANEDLGLNDPARWKWYNDPVLADPQIDRSKLIIGSHYTGIPTMASQAQQLAGTNVPLWYTEVSGKSGSWQDGVATAVEVSEAITRANASAYIYWQFAGLSNSAWDMTGSLFNSGVPNGKYHAVKHLYKYIRPGMQRVTTAVSNDPNTSLGAYRDPKTGAATITLINNGLASNDYTFDVSNFPAGTVFRAWQSTEAEKWVAVPDVVSGSTVTLTLPARSLVTLYSGADLPVQSGSGTWVSPDWVVKDAVEQSRLRRAAMIADMPAVQAALANEDVNSADPNTGWTALHAAAASPFNGSLEIINYLIAQGANVNAVANNGFTPLHAVAANAWSRWEPNNNALLARIESKIQALVTAGAQIDARDSLGRTPLHWSVTVPVMYSHYTYYTNVFNKLVALGADKAALDNAGNSTYDLSTLDYRETYAQAVALAGTVINTVRPVPRHVAYNANANKIDITTTENTTFSFVASDVQIVDLATNQPVTGWTFNDRFNFGITIAEVAFGARLPDGRYRMTIAANAIADQRGLQMAAPIVLDFGVLRGDATGDGVVNFDDLLVVAQNYGKSNRLWKDGDFNGDSVVNFDDLLLTAQQYGAALLLPTQTRPASGTKRVP